MIQGKTYHLAHRLLEWEPMQRCALGECHAACCLYGVWLDLHEVAEIRQYAELIQPYLKPNYHDPDMWFLADQEDDPHCPSGKVIHSLVVDDETHYGGTACVFLRSDNKCALQVAAEKHLLHPWRFKPFYCILHPLDLTEEGEITLDTTDALLQEPGSCLRPSGKSVPLIDTFSPELKYLLGEKEYQEIRLRVYSHSK